MKFLLVAINAKYIHSNPGLYSIRKYAKEHCKEAIDVEISEFTINQLIDDVLESIYMAKPEVVCFSCYIWNIEFVLKLADELSKVLPAARIWLGGPEVSFNCREVLIANPAIDGIMVGEGEATFAELADALAKDEAIGIVKSIVYRSGNEIIVNPNREYLDFATISFPYENIDIFKNRIIYYEASRGCPFGCEYCLSSVEKRMRFRRLEQVERELGSFIEARVPQVKFVDRTFNCDHERTEKILEFIIANDNGITNFHFEIAGDILSKREIELLMSMRAGLVQLEIGVQSTNEKTLEAIHRKTDMTKLWENVRKLRLGNNMHIHLDLIAGLPYEDYKSFVQSFNDVYALKGHELQLGFLKMLKGSPLTKKANEYGIVSRAYPPYEVLTTNWISYSDLLEFKAVTNMLEIYYNSGQFTNSIDYLVKHSETPYLLYKALADFYAKHDYPIMTSKRERKYEILLEYARTVLRDTLEFEERLTLDYYLRENAKAAPSWCHEVDYDIARKVYEEAVKREQLNAGENVKSLMRMTHLELFSYITVISADNVVEAKQGLCKCIFDYSNRSPITNNAKVVLLSQ